MVYTRSSFRRFWSRRTWARSLPITAGCALSALIAGGAPAEPTKKAPKSEATLIVEVTNLRNEKGRVAVAVFDSEDAFPDQERALQGKLVKIKGSRAKVTFKSLKPGTYAVAVLHDENENDEMDFNFLGMPLEGYGFSNDASAMFGPPSFDAAAFRLRATGKSTIKARYFSL